MIPLQYLVRFYYEIGLKMAKSFNMENPIDFQKSWLVKSETNISCLELFKNGFTRDAFLHDVRKCMLYIM